MDKPAAFIERYRRWSYGMRDVFRTLIAEDDYRYGYDPFWVRVEPYRVKVKAGETAELAVTVRNFRRNPQEHRVVFDAASGLTVEPAVLQGRVAGESRVVFPARVRAAADAAPGVRLIGLDITLDGRRYGELFDAIVEVVR